ncbi:PaaI family thioesterase [Novosphingobium sp.]|uniref:PaaI family thioesterase n=1 Tax=Novosphingobium sp. TaxID=1874826 RepID=UPI0026180381|nr:PaaI family thioesterase [Novosphingobium sp.]
MPPIGPPPLAGNWACHTPPGDGTWTIGDVWIDRQSGRLALFVTTAHCNPFDVMHGGALATFADYQCAALRDYSDDGADHTPTVTLSVDYLAPVPRDRWLLAEVTLLRGTGSLIFTQAVMTVDGAKVGRSNAIYRSFKRKDAP